MEKSKFVKANEELAETVVGGYKKIEEGVVGGYKKIENGVVSSFNKITDKFVGQFLTHEGESAEDAKARLAQEQADREATSKSAWSADIGKASVEASRERARTSVDAGKKAGKHD